jgi:hypothetical protein
MFNIKIPCTELVLIMAIASLARSSGDEREQSSNSGNSEKPTKMTVAVRGILCKKKYKSQFKFIEIWKKWPKAVSAPHVLYPCKQYWPILNTFIYFAFKIINYTLKLF